MATSEAAKIREKFAGAVPVLCRRHARPGGAAQSPKAKYLIPGKSKAQELVDAIREDSGGGTAELHLFLSGDAPVDPNTLLSELDAAHTAPDGFLYLTYSAFDAMQLREAAAGKAPVVPMVSPHGDRVPMGASAASCTFLNPRGSAAELPELQPSRGGRVPAMLYVAVTLDVMAVGLVVPLLATYSRHLGGGPRFTGVLQATYGLTQLLGANLLGGLSDTLGRRRLLQTSMAGGLVGYACLAASLGASGGLWLLLASRVPIGLLKQSLAVSRAAVADCTGPASRMRPMSLLGAAVGSGFVVGPALGGILSKAVGMRAPPLLAAVLFAAALCVVSFALPETAPSPLAALELRALFAATERRWRAALGGVLAQRAAAAQLGALPEPTAREICQAVTAEPNGLPVAEEHRREAAERWLEMAAGAPSAAPGEVAWPAAQQALGVVYLQYKEAQGMLHAGSGGGGGGGGGGAGAGAGAGAAGAGGGGATVWRAFEAGRRLLRLPRQVRLLSATRGLVDLSVILVHSVFADYTRLKFGWEAKQAGFGMAFAGLCSVVVDLLLLPALLRRRLLAELPAALGGAALIALGAAGMAVGGGARAFLACAPPGIALLSLGVSLFKAAINTIVINAAPPAHAGLTSGLSDAVEAICRVAAPLAGGMLLEQASLEAPPLVASALCVVGGLAVYEVAPSELKRLMWKPKAA